MKKIRIGLLGFGYIGRAHACAVRDIPLYYDDPDLRAEITHVCTSRPETAKKAAEVLGAVPVTDFREITENPDIDVVDIASPNDKHLPQLLSAMKHGKHIYCDKPLCANEAEAAQIADALRSYSGTSQMTLQYRFFPAAIRAKQLMDEGRLGEILEFHGSFPHSGSADPKTPLKWKLSGAAGGGVAADLGSHIFDLLHWLLGGFDSVCAATRIVYPERPSADDPNKMVPVDAEDAMVTLVRLKNGALGTVSASKIATGTEDGITFTIHGTKGALMLKAMDLDRLYFYDNTAPGAPFGGVRGWTAIDCGQRYAKPAVFPASKAVIGWVRGHIHCYYSFLRAVADGVPAEPSIGQGIVIQDLLAKIKQSAASGSWVKV
ncbi:MAG: Gfo/Idh/MocA family oxidoreductase [Lentisphaeria bacterium]|nr:Gfo/Idh/MocA family oxidoreductase [Lentisphaeria bacterium]